MMNAVVGKQQEELQKLRGHLLGSSWPQLVPALAENEPGLRKGPSNLEEGEGGSGGGLQPVQGVHGCRTTVHSIAKNEADTLRNQGQTQISSGSANPGGGMCHSDTLDTRKTQQTMIRSTSVQSLRGRSSHRPTVVRPGQRRMNAFQEFNQNVSADTSIANVRRRFYGDEKYIRDFLTSARCERWALKQSESNKTADELFQDACYFSQAGFQSFLNREREHARSTFEHDCFVHDLNAFLQEHAARYRRKLQKEADEALGHQPRDLMERLHTSAISKKKDFLLHSTMGRVKGLRAAINESWRAFAPDDAPDPLGALEERYGEEDVGARSPNS